jgi:mRNA interferase HigB
MKGGKRNSTGTGSRSHPWNEISANEPLDFCSQNWEHQKVTVLGEAAISEFAKRYADSRRPLGRFLQIARCANWKTFLEVKQSFPATDYAPRSGTLIFDIGGNKYRLTARVDFEEELLFIQTRHDT